MIARALLALLLAASPAFATDPYSRLTPYSGLLHIHVGTLEGMAKQYGEGDPEDPVTPAACDAFAHSFTHPRQAYVRSFDAGLDFAGLSHHSGGTWMYESAALDTLLTYIGTGQSYAELGSSDTWTFCNPASDGLELSDGSCSRDNATDLDWLYDQAELAMIDRPGHLALVGFEWTVGNVPPDDAAQGGGHKIITTDGDNPVETIFAPNHQNLTDGKAYTASEEVIYKLAREGDLIMQAAHPCAVAGGPTYFGPVNYRTGGGFDPRAIFSMEVGAKSSVNCLQPSEVSASNNANAAYFHLLDVGYHLAPVAADDNHYHTSAMTNVACSYPADVISGALDRTIVLSEGLTFRSLQSSMKSRRSYWARQGRPLARLYAYDDTADRNSVGAIMGGFLTVSDGDFVLEAVVDADGATFADMELWHNSTQLLDSGDAEITCSASQCTLAATVFSSDIRGWWLVLVMNGSGQYEVVSAPIWINRTPDQFRGAPYVPYIAP